MSETTEQKIESTIGTVEAKITEAAPVLSIVNSLASTYGGNIYRRIAGSVEKVASWESHHPEIVAATSMMSTMLAAFGINIGPEVQLGEFVLGALGKLMAADPTVQGPQPPASVQAPTAG